MKPGRLPVTECTGKVPTRRVTGRLGLGAAGPEPDGDGHHADPSPPPPSLPRHSQPEPYPSGPRSAAGTVTPTATRAPAHPPAGQAKRIFRIHLFQSTWPLQILVSSAANITHLTTPEIYFGFSNRFFHGQFIAANSGLD